MGKEERDELRAKLYLERDDRERELARLRTKAKNLLDQARSPSVGVVAALELLRKLADRNRDFESYRGVKSSTNFRPFDINEVAEIIREIEEAEHHLGNTRDAIRRIGGKP